MKIAGVILAGGLARRMGGGDKALLRLGRETLLARVIARLRPQVGEMVLNANGDPTRFAEFGLPVVADTVGGFAGPLAGILEGMRWAAAKGYTHVASAAGDTPFFPADLVARLSQAVQSSGQPISLAALDEFLNNEFQHLDPTRSFRIDGHIGLAHTAGNINRQH